MVKIPKYVQHLLPIFTWRGNYKEKTVFLTFDDGPTIGLTHWLLDVLEEYYAKGTFFCIGENVEKHPQLYQLIKDSGHSIGNHTHNHLNGWHTSQKDYKKNILQCANYIESSLFRPPYGKMTPRQIFSIRKDYNIIMWDVLSRDFDPYISPEQCLKQTIKHVENNSIIVFHDNPKSEKNITFTLPRLLNNLTQQGFQFSAIPREGF